MAQELMDNQFKTQWAQIRGVLRDKWRNLTDEDVQQINGNYDRLVEKLQLRYNYSRSEAEGYIDSWIADRSSRISTSDRPATRSVRESGHVTREPEGNSFLKWLLILGIPLLLLGSYFANNMTSVNTTSTVAPMASDALLTENIRTAFFADPVLGPVVDNIQINSANGVVTLSGNVSSAAQRDLIGNAVRNTAGVRQVVNNLQVRLLTG